MAHWARWYRQLLPEEFFEAKSVETIEPVFRANHTSDATSETFEYLFLELPLTPDCDRI